MSGEGHGREPSSGRPAGQLLERRPAPPPAVDGMDAQGDEHRRPHRVRDAVLRTKPRSRIEGIDGVEHLLADGQDGAEAVLVPDLVHGRAQPLRPCPSTARRATGAGPGPGPRP